MQPVDDVESTKTTKASLNSGEYTFDLSKDGARLRSVRFSMHRFCTQISYVRRRSCFR